MLEALIAAGIVGSVGALWKIAMENVAMRAGLKTGMASVIHELQSLRTELSKDIASLENDIKDHEFRLRDLEKKPLPPTE
jgi:hypothetical protein